MRERSRETEPASPAIWAPPPSPPPGQEQFAPLRRTPGSGGLVRRSGAVLLTALGSAAGYWGFLGWDRHRDLDPITGRLTGPYQPWQVLACGAVVLVLAIVGGWLREVESSSVAITAALVASFAVSGVTDPMDDGLWPVGAVMLAVGVAPAAFGTATAARYVRELVSSRGRRA